ncbi:hypothetical protein DLJ49_13600 [Rhodovulum sp. 12E13]|uniref:hypothetical protein n=1 Tax=Rhodovulum sp. 12E13 TaxID=2203891 RepID=UPI000E17A9B7|nr:hypothetical protein [Rhodovulum sp. 12E13]RDC71672.1 hypothetical protein DLJ49_13600 [Rhodovulum sp. 12E13]
MSTEDDTAGAGRAARLATLPRALAVDGTHLIGTMGAPGLRRGIVRDERGTVRTVARGDMVDGGRIVEVEADALRLHTGDRIARLDLAGRGEGLATSPRPRARPDAAASEAPDAIPHTGPDEALSHARPRPRRYTGPDGTMG